MKKIIIILLGLIVVGGGSAGGAIYMTGGLNKDAHAEEEDAHAPQLVPKEDAEEEEIAEATRRARNGRPDPKVFKATYIPIEESFTSNLRGGDAFVQIGLGLSTYYDEQVVTNVEEHKMAIRSAILMTLSEADPIEITTIQGKEDLRRALKNAVNDVLTNREGFGGIDDVHFTSFVTQ